MSTVNREHHRERVRWFKQKIKIYEQEKQRLKEEWHRLHDSWSAEEQEENRWQRHQLDLHIIYLQEQKNYHQKGATMEESLWHGYRSNSIYHSDRNAGPHRTNEGTKFPELPTQLKLQGTNNA